MPDRVRYLTETLPGLTARMLTRAVGAGVTHHTEPGGPMVLQPCHLDRKNPAFAGWGWPELDRLAVALTWVLEVRRRLAHVDDLPAPFQTWPRFVGMCKSQCQYDRNPIDMLEMLGADKYHGGRGNGHPAFTREMAMVRQYERERKFGALMPAVAQVLRAMGRRYGHEAVLRLADEYDGGVGSPRQRQTAILAGTEDAPDLVFPRSPIVGKARRQMIRARMRTWVRGPELPRYLATEFSDDLAWVRRGSGDVLGAVGGGDLREVRLTPAIVGLDNVRLGSWGIGRRDAFAVGLCWLTVLGRRLPGVDAAFGVPAIRWAEDGVSGGPWDPAPHLILAVVHGPADLEEPDRMMQRRIRLLWSAVPAMRQQLEPFLGRAGVADVAGWWDTVRREFPPEPRPAPPRGERGIRQTPKVSWDGRVSRGGGI